MNLENELDELYEKLRVRSRESLTTEEKVFFEVWDWSTLLCIGGFEKLYENEVSLDDCIKQFNIIGLEETIPIFENVKKYIKPELTEDAQWDYFEENFDELKKLAHKYYEVTENIICQTASKYVYKYKIKKH